jgi:hypothetical protein
VTGPFNIISSVTWPTSEATRNGASRKTVPQLERLQAWLLVKSFGIWGVMLVKVMVQAMLMLMQAMLIPVQAMTTMTMSNNKKYYFKYLQSIII